MAAGGDDFNVDDMPMDKTTATLIERAQEAYKTLGETWDRWVVIGYAFEAGRNDIMRHLQINKPEGGRYSKAMKAWLIRYRFEKIGPSAFSYLMKCMDNLAEITAWRQTLDQSRQIRLNHPQSVWGHFSKRASVPTANRRANQKDEVILKLQDELDEANALLDVAVQSGVPVYAAEMENGGLMLFSTREAAERAINDLDDDETKWDIYPDVSTNYNLTGCKLQYGQWINENDVKYPERQPTAPHPRDADREPSAGEWKHRALTAEQERDEWRRRAEQAEQDLNELYEAGRRIIGEDQPEPKKRQSHKSAAD
jgi:hypothetical protein